MRRSQVFAMAAALMLIATHCALAQTELFVSRRLTPSEVIFTKHIEGPAVDAAGVLYVPNYLRNGTIGTLKPGSTQPELFATLPAGSIGNGLRIDRDGRMYVADFSGHNVFVIERGETKARVFFSSKDFNQPNDLAVANDGTLYASDPNFSPKRSKRPNQVWRIVRDADGRAKGAPMQVSRTMGIVNGIDLSPDGTTLYVSESQKREVWAYRLAGDTLASHRLLKKFDGPPNSELDGLRTDIDGRIYVTHPGSSTVAVLAPDGAPVRDPIRLTKRDPSNLAFGGPDGKTVFVTQTDGRFIETFRVDRPGREFCQLHPQTGC